MKVSELEGAKLDYWVAKVEGLTGAIEEIGGVKYFLQGDKCRIGYSPSTDWSQGGPIIEREGIDPDPMIHYEYDPYKGEHTRGKPEHWVCFLGHIDGSGSTLLVAAMRCYVASKFGEEVVDEV